MLTEVVEPETAATAEAAIKDDAAAEPEPAADDGVERRRLTGGWRDVARRDCGIQSKSDSDSEGTDVARVPALPDRAGRGARRAATAFTVASLLFHGVLHQAGTRTPRRTDVLCMTKRVQVMTKKSLNTFDAETEKSDTPHILRPGPTRADSRGRRCGGRGGRATVR